MLALSQFVPLKGVSAEHGHIQPVLSSGDGMIGRFKVPMHCSRIQSSSAARKFGPLFLIGLCSDISPSECGIRDKATA